MPLAVGATVLVDEAEFHADRTVALPGCDVEAGKQGRGDTGEAHPGSTSSAAVKSSAKIRTGAPL